MLARTPGASTGYDELNVVADASCRASRGTDDQVGLACHRTGVSPDSANGASSLFDAPAGLTASAALREKQRASDDAADCVVAR